MVRFQHCQIFQVPPTSRSPSPASLLIIRGTSQIAASKSGLQIQNSAGRIRTAG